MTFAKLQGWTVPATVRTSPKKKIRQYGELNRRFRNRPVRHRKGLERAFTLTTPKLDELCADTLEGLLEGRNHRWPFVVDAFSDSGIGPELGSGWTLSSTGGPTATRGHYLTQTGGSLIYDVGLVDDPVAPDGGRWTVMWWQLVSGSWVRRALRSDGTKFENGVSTTSVFSGVTVSVGAIVISGGAEVADLVALSFYACDEFLSQEYEWVSGFGMAHRWSLNNTYADSLGAVSALSNLTSFAKGSVRRGVDFDPGEYLDGLGAVGVGIDGLSEITVMGWVDLNATRPAFNTVFDLRLVGPTTDKFFFGYRTSGVAEVGARSSAADFSSQRVFTTSPVYSFGATGRQHWACSVDLVTNTNRIWINGVEQSVSGTPAYAGTVFSGGCVNGFISYDVADNDVDGVVDEVKVFHRGLTTAQVLAIYNTERKGQPYPGPRFSSAFPRIDLWGDIDGCREPVEVIGEVTDEVYVQRGSSTGWVNNDREIAAALHVVKSDPKCVRIPRPDLGYAFGTDQLANPQTSSDLPKSIGSEFSLSSAGLGLSSRGYPGPFNFPDKAFGFGTDYARVNASTMATFFQGAESATVMAWVRSSALGASQYVWDQPIDNANNVRLRLLVNGAGAVSLFAKSEAADGLPGVTSSATLAVDTWYLVGGTVDLINDEAKVFIDGVEDNDATASFGANVFSSEGPTVSPYAVVGASSTLASIWTGSIAGVYLWRRKLTSGEILELYELGKKGVFA